MKFENFVEKLLNVFIFFRLLNKSIIRVEQPDIHFDDEDVAHTAGDDDGNQDVEMQENGENGEEEDGLQKKRITLSFEDYKNISNMLVLHMRNEESKAEDLGTDTGMKKIEIINWYLEQVADQIETEEELISRKTLIEKVIDRLINHDSVVIPLKTVELKTKGGAEDSEDTDDDTLLVVHPNYVIE